MDTPSGVLYIVATPIGNLADLSARARAVLAAVDLVLAEDTRHSQILLNHHAIQTPLLSLHQYNEQERLDDLLQRLHQGQDLAVISDAGTPLISDPGYRLVSAAHAADIPVHAVPGPSALTAALSVAGQPTDRFVFEGFLPAKQGARRKRLASLSKESRTLVFYETPHRLDSVLADMVEAFGGERPATLCKELSKQFEHSRRGTLAGLRQWLEGDPKRGQGEFVIVIAGSPDTVAEGDVRPLLVALLRHLPVKTATAIAAEVSDHSRNDLYQLALEIKDEK